MSNRPERPIGGVRVHGRQPIARGSALSGACNANATLLVGRANHQLSRWTRV